MNLTFYGAAESVTGSCFCVEVSGRRVLIDCGLQQGRDEVNNYEFAFAPNEIDYVLVTHAHIDHSGRLPLLTKYGFKGRMIATRLTADLLSIMLRDSAHIHESDAEWKNRKNKRSGGPQIEPLYTIDEAVKCVMNIESCEYGEMFELDENIKARFVDAGHLLGSAMIELWATENGETRKLVFSGDIGNRDQPIIREPSTIDEADYVVMESTYGDRNHDANTDYEESLAAIMDETFARGGTVVIPAFAVGRTQELLYFLRDIKERGLVKSYPDFPVYLDSPLAKAATTIFSGDLTGYIDEEAELLVREGMRMLTFPNLQLTETVQDSRMLNFNTSPKVIISASGMCDAGRIRHHLKHNLWRETSTVVFVGYQAGGTLGRSLLEGAKSVKMFGEEIAVKAKIINFPGLSSHADRDHLLQWLMAFKEKPRRVFVVHGDVGIIKIFAETVRQLGFDAHVPQYTEVYDLIENKIKSPGFTPERPRREVVSTVFERLTALGRQLMDVITKNKGLANKELAKFADQIQALIKKWDV
jgi:metallo-beta-lactamase family protein